MCWWRRYSQRRLHISHTYGKFIHIVVLLHSSINHDHRRVYPKCTGCLLHSLQASLQLVKCCAETHSLFAAFYRWASGHLLAFDVNDSLPLFYYHFLPSCIISLYPIRSVSCLLRHALLASNAAGKACKGSVCHGVPPVLAHGPKPSLEVRLLCGLVSLHDRNHWNHSEQQQDNPKHEWYRDKYICITIILIIIIVKYI